MKRPRTAILWAEINALEKQLNAWEETRPQETNISETPIVAADDIKKTRNHTDQQEPLIRKIDQDGLSGDIRNLKEIHQVYGEMLQLGNCDIANQYGKLFNYLLRI